MRLLLVGRGRMGTLIREMAPSNGDEVVDALGRDDLGKLESMGRCGDVVIDFSGPVALPQVCAYVARTGTPLVSGTTGLSPEDHRRLEELGQHAPVLWASNFSLGVAVMARALRQMSSVLEPDFDVEIVEIHHGQKVDAPSGTAKFLKDSVDPLHRMESVYGREGACGKRPKGEIGIHALRGGTVAGTHTVYFLGPDEELEVTHRASSRRIFAGGALRMAHLLAGRPNGLYDMQKILFEE